MSTVIIPVVDNSNLDQKNLIDKTPFYCQPINTGLDCVKTEVWADACQTYNLYVKQDFYLKCAGKSYNIFSLIDSYFIDTIVISSNKDISFNYSMTAKIPVSKYKLVYQALINWFSPVNWWRLVFPTDSVCIINLTTSERLAVSEYPRIPKDGQKEQVIHELCHRIDALIRHITTGETHNTKDGVWLRFCEPNLSVRPGAKLLPNPEYTRLSGRNVLDYLVAHTGFKQLCRQEYQGIPGFLLFNLPPAIPELCLSAFIRGNKLIGISQTDMVGGYSARLSKLVHSYPTQIIQWITNKWHELISHDGGHLEYEDVVLTLELVPGNEFLDEIRLWNIEMAYGAWAHTGSKLFTWAELDLLTGNPPVIKIITIQHKPQPGNVKTHGLS